MNFLNKLKKFFKPEDGFEDDPDKIGNLKEILNCSFSIKVNLNDVFGYACAESFDLDIEDINPLHPLFYKYGVWDTLIAVASVAENDRMPIDPVYERIGHKKWKKMTEDVKALSDKGKILWELYFIKNKDNKEKIQKDLVDAFDELKEIKG